MGPLRIVDPLVTLAVMLARALTVTDAEPLTPSCVAVTVPEPEVEPAVKVVELPLAWLKELPEMLVVQDGSTLTGLP